LKISVIGIPKTIDNDVSFVQRTFGFETAVTEARARRHANAEAEAARNVLPEADGPRFGFIAADRPRSTTTELLWFPRCRSPRFPSRRSGSNADATR
jgi:6-phosphofructokinase